MSEEGSLMTTWVLRPCVAKVKGGLAYVSSSHHQFRHIRGCSINTYALLTDVALWHDCCIIQQKTDSLGADACQCAAPRYKPQIQSEQRGNTPYITPTLIQTLLCSLSNVQKLYFSRTHTSSRVHFGTLRKNDYIVNGSPTSRTFETSRPASTLLCLCSEEASVTTSDERAKGHEGDVQQEVQAKNGEPEAVPETPPARKDKGKARAAIQEEFFPHVIRDEPQSVGYEPSFWDQFGGIGALEEEDAIVRQLQRFGETAYPGYAQPGVAGPSGTRHEDRADLVDDATLSGSAAMMTTATVISRGDMSQ
ncbi:hypothetical protein FRC01_009301 [Tulasnella sp. 417]|nr:hypothetical protein FRC01_009301 [Tulasnella sp. 417]